MSAGNEKQALPEYDEPLERKVTALSEVQKVNCIALLLGAIEGYAYIGAPGAAEILENFHKIVDGGELL